MPQPRPAPTTRDSLRAAVFHLLAGRREDIPPAAELVQVLALRGAGLRVGDVAVERVAVVRHLELAVGAPRRAEPGTEGSPDCVRLARGDERGPDARTGSVARARRALVLFEQVERPTAPVDKDPAQP